MTAFVLGLPEHKVRVIAPDVGGGFGSKIYLYAEDVVVHLGGEAAQPPDQVDRRALAKRSSPTRTAATTSPRPSSRSTRTASSSPCACRPTANLGAYLSTFASCIPTILYATLLAGPVHDAARSTAR